MTSLPVLFVRSALLGVRPTRMIDRRGWGKDCIDLLDCRRYTAGRGELKELARCYGFAIAEPDVDGSHVEQLIEADPGKVGRYVESDVAITCQLYQFYKGFFVPNVGQRHGDKPAVAAEHAVVRLMSSEGFSN